MKSEVISCTWVSLYAEPSLCSQVLSAKMVILDGHKVSLFSLALSSWLPLVATMTIRWTKDSSTFKNGLKNKKFQLSEEKKT